MLFCQRFEEGEMDASIDLFLHESRMLLERMFVSVLQNQITLRIDETGIEYLVRYGLETFQRIRRIREDNVKALLAYRNEIEHVMVNRGEVLEAQCPGLVFYE